MVNIEVTMVRLKGSHEPVAIYGQVNDLIALGRMVDEIVDPAACDYADCVINVDFGIVCSRNSSYGDNNEILYAGLMTLPMFESIAPKFKSKKTKWTEFPEDFDFLGTTAPEHVAKDLEAPF